MLLPGEPCNAVLAVDRLKLFEIVFSDLHVMETVLHLLPIMSKESKEVSWAAAIAEHDNSWTFMGRELG